MTLHDVKLMMCPGLTKDRDTGLSISILPEPQTAKSVLFFFFFPAASMLAVSEYRTLLLRHCLSLATAGFVYFLSKRA